MEHTRGGPAVLMFHSVAEHLESLPWKSLLCSPGRFDTFLSCLKGAGYRSVRLSECIAHLREGLPLPPRAVVITFDDGYLDNWVNAYPLLKKHGYSAAVFVATDFIDPRDTVRKTLEDYWAGKSGLHELDCDGYLSLAELREMTRDGTFEVGSHTRTHTWYFTSPQIVDFHRPGDPYVWLEWNRNPSGKPFWMKRPRDGQWGAPVYAYSPALTGRIYREKEGLRDALVRFVSGMGGEAFFREKGWRKKLLEVTRSLESGGDAPAYETEEEYLERARDEIKGSREILEEGLGHDIRLLAWPNDAYNGTLMELACGEAGYELVCTVRDCRGRAGSCLCMERIYIGQKYRSAALDSLWFRAKVAMAGGSIAASLIRAAAGVRRHLRSLQRRGNVPGGGYEGHHSE